ncbi:hypothetical protein WS70_08675 [Burkholderia mayonis]|uniref:Uncharacterized protein n=1 Tax=Burkholderia mayonis TaxID=1385591 RepID=A0A1B4FE22_9BURK|nr:hypothetical protein WS70_08675 [Burkholderia mayonis]KVE41135.1 hypothetical protein WS70_15635 [Burkholderia mayonis]
MACSLQRQARQRCARLQAGIDESLLVGLVEAALAANTHACHPHGQKGQFILGHGWRPQVVAADAIVCLLSRAS